MQTNLSITVEGSKDNGVTILASFGKTIHRSENVKTEADMLKAMSTLAIFLLDRGIEAGRIAEIQEDIRTNLSNGYSEGPGLGLAIGTGASGVSVRGHNGDEQFETSDIVDVDQIPTAISELETWLRANMDSDLSVRTLLARTEEGLKHAIEIFWTRVKNGEFKKPEEAPPQRPQWLDDFIASPTVEGAEEILKRGVVARDSIIKDVKQLRKDFDEVLQRLKTLRDFVEGEWGIPFKDGDEVDANLELAIRHGEDAIMRLGMVMKNIGGEPSPYPNSYNPNNAIVEPTADNLKL